MASRGGRTRFGILAQFLARASPTGPATQTRGSRIKRTYQPKKRYRRRVHGFLRRMSTPAGARIVRDRRRKGRHRITP